MRLLFTLLSALCCSVADAAEQMDLEHLKMVAATVFNCNDGDTCRLKIADGLWLNVRLAGIDAPEVGHGKKKPGQPFGDEARNFLNELIKGKTVQLRQTDLDPFNRPVVELILSEVVVNRKLIQAGFAEAYRGKTKRLDLAPYFEDEATAKKAGLGIWSLKNYTSPSAYRKSAKPK